MYVKQVYPNTNPGGENLKNYIFNVKKIIRNLDSLDVKTSENSWETIPYEECRFFLCCSQTGLEIERLN